MDTITLHLGGRESLALVKVIQLRLDYLEKQERTQAILEEVASLYAIIQQAGPQISQMAAKSRADRKHQQN